MNRTKLYINDKPAVVGQKVVSFRGEKAKLISWTPPHKPSSTGRVYIKFEDGNQQEYFPSVIGGEFKEDKVDA